jgi:hypothetical protein
MSTWHGPAYDTNGDLITSERFDIKVITSVINTFIKASDACEITQGRNIYDQCCQDCKDLLLVHMIEFIPTSNMNLEDRSFIFEHMLHDLELAKGEIQESSPEAVDAISKSLDILLGNSE